MADSSTLQAFSAELQEPAFLREKRLAAIGRYTGDAPELVPAALPSILLSEEDEPLREKIRIDVLGRESESSDAFSKIGTLLLAEDQPGFRHAAFLTGAVAIVIPEDVILKHPLRIVWQASHPWTATHTLLIVGPRAQVTVSEELRSEGEGTWSHAREVMVEEEATATFASLQIADSKCSLLIRSRGQVSTGGSLTWHEATLGGKDLEEDMQSETTGAHAQAIIQWLFYAKNTERYRLSCRNIFQESDGSGDIQMRGVAEEQAHVLSKGMIDIGLQGRGTSTYLTQEVLMLDATALVDAIPALEIKTNDVKASHSATVARVTEEDLFYFAARGIGKTEARGMFVKGFLTDLTQRLPDPSLQERVQEEVERKYLL